jgi:hypothetical protein
MAKGNKINKVIKILQEKENMLPGSLSRLIQEREGGRNRPYWYLTWKESGKSRAIYIPSEEAVRVARGVENLKRVRSLISEIAMEKLRELREGRHVGKRR